MIDSSKIKNIQEMLLQNNWIKASKLLKKVEKSLYHRKTKKELEALIYLFSNDLHGLLIYKKDLWVLTSTYDEKKGIMVDVFDIEGVFKDSFYLPLVDSKERAKYAHLYQKYCPMTIHGEYLYVIEYDEDDTFRVVKYLIQDSN